MSSSLVKQRFLTYSKTEEKRVIDSNGRMENRLAWLRENQGGSEFVSGLTAQVLEVPEDAEGGNVIRHEEPEQTLEQAQSRAEEILAEARKQAGEILNEAKVRGEAEKMQILEQARQQGYSEGQNRAMAEAETAKRELKEKEKQLEEEYQQLADNLEPDLVAAITGIYEHIFHVELHSYREILSYLISSTLRKQEGGHEFLVHVSRDDYPYVSMQKKQILSGIVSSNCNVEVVEDLALTRNQCMIETENGIFDCGLDTQLTELKKRLTLLSWVREE